MDILCRTLKQLVGQESSYLMKKLNGKYKQEKKFSEKTQEELIEKQEFFSENYFKNRLIYYCNSLLSQEVSISSILKIYFFSLFKTGDENKRKQSTISAALNFSRMRIFDLIQSIQTPKEISKLMSCELINEIISLPLIEANLFLNFLQSHFNISLSHDMNKKLRNDKYFFQINPAIENVKASDISSINYQTTSYVTLKERAILFLIKQSSSSAQSCVKASSELVFPPALYKLKTGNIFIQKKKKNNDIKFLLLNI
jgi:hypothetical protein